jgi:hypothetical protein
MILKGIVERALLIRHFHIHPPTPGVVRMSLKGKDLQIGMLEVVEKKGRACAD